MFERLVADRERTTNAARLLAVLTVCLIAVVLVMYAVGGSIAG